MNQPSHNSKLIGTAQVASLLNCSIRTVHRRVVAGDLSPALTVPGGAHGIHLFDIDEVHAYMQARKEGEAA